MRRPKATPPKPSQSKKSWKWYEIFRKDGPWFISLAALIISTASAHHFNRTQSEIQKAQLKDQQENKTYQISRDQASILSNTPDPKERRRRLEDFIANQTVDVNIKQAVAMILKNDSDSTVRVTASAANASPELIKGSYAFPIIASFLTYKEAEKQLAIFSHNKRLKYSINIVKRPEDNRFILTLGTLLSSPEAILRRNHAREIKISPDAYILYSNSWEILK